VTPEIEKELREQIETIKTPAPLPVPVHASPPEEVLQRAAISFADWLRDWRTTAQVGLHRRDYRIMLGISRRKTTVELDEDDVGASPPTALTTPGAVPIITTAAATKPATKDPSPGGEVNG
jgi:hypothetical protein